MERESDMKSLKQLQKRALALFMALVLCLSLLPATALAGEQVPDFRATVSSASYPTVKRESAGFVYTRPGVSSNVDLICLVDNSARGGVARDMSAVIGSLSGLFLASGATGRTIAYQYLAEVSEGLTNEDLSAAGQANEVAGLTAALTELNKHPDRMPVVFWALNTNVQDRDPAVVTEINQKLDALKAALAARGGELITWQKADAPEEWLKGYTDHAYAATGNDFRTQARASLEAAFCDYTENLHLKLEVTDLAALTEPITSASTSAGSVNVAEDKRSVTLDVLKLYDHQWLQISLDTALNLEKNEKGVAVHPTDVSGTHYGGIFDQPDSTKHSFPDAMIDRTLRTIELDGGTVTDQTKEVKALPGELVLLPGADEWSVPGNTFGGWKSKTGGDYYKPNQILVMPEKGAQLTAQWGHTELQLRLGEVTPAEPQGNQMADGIQLRGRYEKGSYNTFDTSGGLFNGYYDVTSVTFSDQLVDFTGDKKPKGKVTVSLPDGGSYATSAYYIGKDENNPVIAYLTRTSPNANTYDLTICGEGGVTAPASMDSFFANLKNLKAVHFNDLLDTSGTTDMSSMFWMCEKLESVDVENLDTSNVTDMSYMFYGQYREYNKLTSLKVDGWDTSNVTNMSYMFNGCTKLTSLDVSNFKTSNVTDMSHMFGDCQKLESLDVSRFKTSNVTNMDAMFYGCHKLTTLDLSNFDTSSVTNMSSMFSYCYNLTSKDMPEEGKGLNISSFDTSNVTSMYYMFNGCYSLTELDLSNFNTSNVTNMSSMFSDCSGLTSLNLSSFDTSKVKDMSCMFDSCKNLTSLDVSNFNTSSVMYMGSMFSGCGALTKLNVSKWQTPQVEDMSSMFSGCGALTELNVSKWQTPQVTNMSRMFYGCKALAGLDVSGWKTTSELTNTSEMFYDCDKLIELNLSQFDTSGVTSMKDVRRLRYLGKSHSGRELLSGG